MSAPALAIGALFAGGSGIGVGGGGGALSVGVSVPSVPPPVAAAQPARKAVSIRIARHVRVRAHGACAACKAARTAEILIIGVEAPVFRYVICFVRASDSQQPS